MERYYCRERHSDSVATLLYQADKKCVAVSVYVHFHSCNIMSTVLYIRSMVFPTLTWSTWSYYLHQGLLPCCGYRIDRLCQMLGSLCTCAFCVTLTVVTLHGNGAIGALPARWYVYICLYILLKKNDPQSSSDLPPQKRLKAKCTTSCSSSSCSSSSIAAAAEEVIQGSRRVSILPT